MIFFYSFNLIINTIISLDLMDKVKQRKKIDFDFLDKLVLNLER